MFAEFALTAINWRNPDRYQEQPETASSISSVSYLSVFSIFQESMQVDVEKQKINDDDEDEHEHDTFTTTSSHGTEPDGDDSGYGFFAAAVAHEHVPAELCETFEAERIHLYLPYYQTVSIVRRCGAGEGGLGMFYDDD